ncbi:hypothetical protein [Flavivirga rizhaonensis]|uniref:hypothetical protein n=1 Tax=Flavivirga rizhaonensis TaxID=2559571 RepID=UPI001476ED05|nr:hypothetical protein [Flavivirga rizhaonensis]
MNYHIKALSISNQDAVVHLKQSNTDFGTASKTVETLKNPALCFISGTINTIKNV